MSQGPISLEAFHAMLAQDLASGTTLKEGELLADRYANIPGAATGYVSSEFGVLQPAEVQELVSQNVVEMGIPVGTFLSALGLSGTALGTAITTAETVYNATKSTSTALKGESQMVYGESTDLTTLYGFGGPGVPEPAAGVMKAWNVVVNSPSYGTWRVYFWKMADGYTLCYNPRTKSLKRYKQRKNIVLSSNPRLNTIARAERAVYGKLKSLAKKSDYLKIAKK